MATQQYKGYTIQIVGLSHTIYRELVRITEHAQSICSITCAKSVGYAQSMAHAKRLINEDRRKA